MSRPDEQHLSLSEALALATAHQRAGNLPVAAQLYQAILAVVPQHAESWHQLGLIRLQQGDLDQADASLRQALSFTPDIAAYWMHHGIILKRRGQLNQALAAYDQALTLQSDYPEAHNNRGNVLSDLGRPREALAAFDQAAQLKPNFAEANRGRAHSLSQLGRLQDALAAIDQVLALRPEDSASHAQRIILLKRLDRLDEALAASDAALARFPQEAALSITRGGILKAQGRIDAACADYQRALTLQPNNIEALINLIQERRLPPEVPALAPLQAALHQPRLDVVRRKDLHFALATLHDQRHETDAAFHHYQAGHAARAEHLRHRYDTDQARVRLTRLCQTCTTDFFTARRAWGHPSTRPIFILGMPRSGTTLTEQILGSHQQVCAGGEQPTVAMMIRLLPRRYPEAGRYPAAVTRLSREQLAAMARGYLRNLPAPCLGAAWVVDKMPHNFQHLGLIRLLFPHAPIIHVQRDPRDNALSNYQQNFGARFGGMGFAFDLEKLARQINDYHRVMAHWRAIGLNFFEFWYEDLVADQIGVTRQLLDYVGLDWDDGVMDFHQLERSVRTASVAQVRRKIYRTSAQKWRRYEQALQPLIDAFDPRWVRYYPGAEAPTAAETA
ncbi:MULTISPECIES: tetratricopeptide repeat-containing sulfotransferase family protein [Thiorhodovibrio]|uniref:tetratricopeptide repeat-containing sulfotransferase family protein n=1 Tax=Thiorhodovibrio TaxID=61593 RepID=UPI0019131CFB|nr:MULTISPECIES: tetratricopeptide repeat-containing sulfotransferase family protein [Thiorhodovibrio]MBK5969054.1 hypothetical protein [Thiorhodovibrio winogradskyi]WPL15064.1 lipoprotein NlpI [Thiorhodovibrio litoralis]